MQSQAVRRQLIRIALIAAAFVGGLSTAAGKGNTPPPPLAVDPTPIQIFGVWHCGTHYCDWNEDIDTTPDGAFDKANRYLSIGTRPNQSIYQPDPRSTWWC